MVVVGKGFVKKLENLVLCTFFNLLIIWAAKRSVRQHFDDYVNTLTMEGQSKFTIFLYFWYTVSMFVKIDFLITLVYFK